MKYTGARQNDFSAHGQLCQMTSRGWSLMFGGRVCQIEVQLIMQLPARPCCVT
jgi:hypothetical protein